jgi:hypothetical protein
MPGSCDNNTGPEVTPSLLLAGAVDSTASALKTNDNNGSSSFEATTGWTKAPAPFPVISIGKKFRLGGGGDLLTTGAGCCCVTTGSGIAFVHLPDHEIVQLIEDPSLLQNKCTGIRACEGPDGQPSILLAYPKIARAIRNLQQQPGDQELAATANGTMACLVRPTDPAASVKLFNLAIRKRPNDWFVLCIFMTAVDTSFRFRVFRIR